MLWPAASQALTAGDINDDCAINSVDVLLIARHVDPMDPFVLTGDALVAADVAPLGAADTVVNAADFVVLARVVKGDIALTLPIILDPATSPTTLNPISMTGSVTCPATEATLHVNGRVETTASVDAFGDFSFSEVVLLDDDNSIHASAEVNGAPGVSNVVTVHYDNELPHSNLENPMIGDGVNPTTVVWTPGSTNPYTGPYKIGRQGANGTLTVKSGAKLILTEGVVLKFEGQVPLPTIEFQTHGILVEPGGELVIRGSESNKVVLTSEAGPPVNFLVDPALPAIWRGILLEGNATAFIEHAQISGAAAPVEANNNSHSSKNVVTLRNLAIDLRTGDYAVRVFGTGDGPPFVVWTIGNSDVTVEENSLTRGGSISGYGVILASTGHVLIADSEFRGHIRGILIRGSSAPTITQNIIRFNHFGIDIFDTAAPMIATGNAITNNNTGIRVWFSGAGATGPYPAPIVNGNDIFSNAGINYRVEGNANVPQALALDATQNWWGTEILNDIASSIQHAIASAGPTVDFTPYQDASGNLVGDNVLFGGLVGDTTLLSGVTYSVTSDVFVGRDLVGNGVTLTIEPGAILEFAPLAGIIVEDGGALDATGTTANHIIFRCDLSCGGSWQGIEVKSGGSAIIHYAEFTDVFAALDLWNGGYGELRFSDIRSFTYGVRNGGWKVNPLVSPFLEAGDAWIANNVFTQANPVSGILVGPTPVGPPSVSVDIDANQFSVWGPAVHTIENVPGVQIRNNTITKFRRGVLMEDCAAPNCGTIDGNTFDPTGSGWGDESAAIELINASPLITNNTIINATIGLYVHGTSNPLIGDGDYANKNVITNNVWGIWIQGNYVQGVQVLPNPNPVIRANEIHSNAGNVPTGNTFCRPGMNVGANICFSNMQPDGTITIDATGNHWGALATATDIANSIVSADFEVPVNFSDYLDAAGVVVAGTSGLFSLVITNVSHDTDEAGVTGYIWPAFPGAGPKTLNVYFDTLATADLSLEIYAVNKAVKGALVASRPIGGPMIGEPAGSHMISWDGKDDQGAPVQSGGHYYVIKAVSNGGQLTATYDPPPLSFELGSVLGSAEEPKYMSGFNVYRNEHVKILATVQNYPLWISLNFVPDFDAGAPFQASVEVLEELVLPVRSDNLIVWNGRMLDGNFFDPSTFEITLIDLEAHAESAQAPLQRNLVVVERSTPQIRGPEYEMPAPLHPNVEVKSNPWLIHASYDQVSTLRYCVDRPSKVTIKVLDPNGVEVETLLDNASVNQGAGTCLGSDFNEVEWLAYEAADTNRIQSIPGAMTFTIEAVPDVAGQEHLISTYRGVIQLLH